MQIKELINEAPEGTRVSFLYPCIDGCSGETIVSLDELRTLVNLGVDKDEAVTEN